MVSDSLNRIKGQPATEEYVRAIKESSVTAFAGWSSRDMFFPQTDRSCSILSSVGDGEGCLTDPTYCLFLMDAFQTLSTLLVFILVMLFNPDVQTHAQAEIDLVIGVAQLPVFDDHPSLPYIDAVPCETLHWRPVVPLGIPTVHYVTTWSHHSTH